MCGGEERKGEEGGRNVKGCIFNWSQIPAELIDSLNGKTTTTTTTEMPVTQPARCFLVFPQRSGKTNEFVKIIIVQKAGGGKKKKQPVKR